MAKRKKPADASGKSTGKPAPKDKSNSDGSSVAPPDQGQRDAIVSQLDTTMLVEASAGAGKTRSMVDRMIALVREGKCGVETLAAITFTRKAAAELRGRFQIALEKATREASGAARQRLSEAASRVEQVFIGTIHSFCGRLLRERPVEAGVDPSFTELDDVTDARLLEVAWAQYVDLLNSSDDPLMTELTELGLSVGDLKESFLRYATYPDVDEWPAQPIELPDLKPVRTELLAYVDHMEQLLETFPEDVGNDKLMPKYILISRLARQMDLEQPAQMMEILAEFGEPNKTTIVQRNWPGGKTQAVAELERWNLFTEHHAARLVSLWRQARYAVIMRLLAGAVVIYDWLRTEAGGLNYQDLLRLAARLLRDKRQIRKYFRRRFTHLLVDEFQDTDPVQAEVMLLLTADNPAETSWRRAIPVPGALFVVGDPKQSIYRFRRADIVTYNEVKKIIAEHGEVIRLTANFRSQKPVIRWVNQTFDQVFPEVPDAYSPERAAMDAVHDDKSGQVTGTVEVLRIPAEYGKNEEALAFDCRVVADAIHGSLANSAEHGEVKPSDFLIISTRKQHLAHYARELAVRGIPCEVTGGAVLNEVRELALLCLCLEAVAEPDNPVALVAMLRSELFGLSDELLYAFKRSGGRFAFQATIPEAVPVEVSNPLAAIFDRLKKHASWLKRLPPAAAIERIAADLGLPAHAALGPGGNVRAGSIARALELIRAAQATLHSIGEAVAYLRTLVDGEEKHDGLPAAAPQQPPLRVMNLHQAKGLEAPVVFLADPMGKWDHEPTLHVNRGEDRVQGYLSVSVKRGDRRSELLAHPSHWDLHSAEEQKFQDAEKNRLLYVAATRPGQRLVISQREKGNRWNPWSPLEPYLANCPAMAFPEPQAITRGPGRKIDADEPMRVAEQISSRWAVARKPSYSMQAAKTISITPSKLAPSAGEHGTEWGSAIHLLLEIAMRDPRANLHRLACTILAEQGLGPALAEKAVETAQTVIKSDLWKRAQASTRRLVEVPFQKLTPIDPQVPNSVPTIVRGVIDLVFHESQGWAVVDYKTDARPESELPSLVKHYRGQVETYGTFWQETTGEPVTEMGLYFTHTSTYVRL